MLSISPDSQGIGGYFKPSKTLQMKTKVKFLIDIEDSNIVYAYFPEEPYSGKHPDLFLCYDLIGQHHGCHNELAALCDPATPDQYQNIKKELEGLGYELEILN